MTTKAPMLISGAGIAGLSLMRLLQNAGIPCVIIEKNATITSAGAGIALPANAVKALRIMGLGDKIDTHAHQVKDIIYAKSSGQVLSRASLMEAPLNTDKFVALPRAALQSILLEDLPPSIYFNTMIDTLEVVENGVHVTFNSPHIKEGTYAAVIGADGLHSRVGELAFDPEPLVDLGVTTWRWLCHYPTDHLQPTYMLGSQDAFLAYPVGNNQVYCYAHRYDPTHAFIKQSQHHELIKKQFGHYKGIAKEMLSILPESSAIIAGRLRSVAQPLFAKGPIALVGDAGNACSPMLQQGAACAFEDTIVLARLLAAFPAEMACQYYEEYRHQRVNWIVNASDTPMKSINKTPSFLALWARNLYIRKKGPLNVQGWRQLLAHDPLQSLEAFIQSKRV